MIFEALLVASAIMAVVAVELKDLLHSVIVLGGASTILAAIYYMLSAPDIAITQAAVIAGVATAVFVITIKKTERFEK